MSPTYVLTAAHCLVGRELAENITVLIGALNCTHNGVVAPFETPEVEFIKAITYVAYDGFAVLSNGAAVMDIAMILLSQPSKHTPMRLDAIAPFQYSPNDLSSANWARGVVAGWGRISEYGPVSQVLVNGDAPVVPFERCSSFFNLKGIAGLEGVLCTQLDQGGVDACEGDSG